MKTPTRVPSSDSDLRGTLSHLVVLDLTQFLAGPHCTQILADLGARVIKIEPPEGDPTRKLPPHFVKGQSAYFLSVNRSKESVVINLKHPEGRDLFLRMVPRADLIVESFRPGVMARLGLGYEVLARLNPRVVLCSITGFGQNGPYASRAAYDVIVQALSGAMSITGEPGRAPVRAGPPIGDLVAGMYGAIAALAALGGRSASGQGQHIDIAMLDCQVAMLSYQAVYYLVSGQVPGPQGRGHASIPTYRSFTCRDGREIIIAATTEKMWEALCRVLRLPGLISDERFQTNVDRFQHEEALWEILERRFRDQDADEWLGRLQDSGVPVATVNAVDEALRDPQVRHRQMVRSIRHRDGEDLRLVASPIRMKSTSAEMYRWPPDLGQHTRTVLEGWLGLSSHAVDTLARSSIIHEAPPQDAASEARRNVPS